LEINGQEFEGRKLEVRFASAPIPRRGEDRTDKKQESKTTVFVGGISFQSTRESVEKFFSECGTIAAVRLALNEDGKPRGYAHVEFQSEDAVKNALKLTGKSLDGREIRVDIAGARRERSSGDRYGSRRHGDDYHHGGSRDRHDRYKKRRRPDD
jgi:nucleolin